MDRSGRLPTTVEATRCHRLGVTSVTPGRIAGDTAEEVLSLAPSVAGALITSLQAEGDPLPATMRPASTRRGSVRGLQRTFAISARPQGGRA